MAKNPHPERSNLHTLYLADSGGGKSQAIGQNKAIPKRGVRHIFLDPDEDHKVGYRAYTLPDFKAALIKGIKSKKGFRIAYSGDTDLKVFDKCCELIYSSLNGGVLTYITIEELTASVDSSGQAKGYFGKLLRQGRKYGAIIHICAQRAAEVPKTAFTQCKTKFIGVLDLNDVPTVSKKTGFSPERLTALNELEFLYKDTSFKAGQEPELVKFKYKKLK